jgi:general stress protein YciG
MTTPKQPKGFRKVSAERRREIARMGGKAVKTENRSFSRDPELARKAGAKGGRGVNPEQRSFSQNRTLARAAGRKGGLSRE